MTAVFADTFYFLGLLNRADESHSRCAAFAREYRGPVVTSAYVLVEVADGLATPSTACRPPGSFRLSKPTRG
jgi:hypothetical protein